MAGHPSTNDDETIRRAVERIPSVSCSTVDRPFSRHLAKIRNSTAIGIRKEQVKERKKNYKHHATGLVQFYEIHLV